MNGSDLDETLKVAPTKMHGTVQTTLCRFYGTSNGCRKGDSCTFIHADPQPHTGTFDHPDQTNTRTEENNTTTPSAEETPLCRSFRWTGSCRFGDSCRFSHNLSDDEKPEPFSSPSIIEADMTDDDWTQAELSELEVESETRPAEVTSTQTFLPNPTYSCPRNVTILSQDGQQTWTLYAQEIAPSSQLLASVFAYSIESIWEGTSDPCMNIRGLVRRPNNPDTFQLQGVGADDFEIFLTVLRAHPKFDFPPDYLKVTYTLASDWGFDGLRHRARCGLANNLSPLDKLTLARRCKDGEWVQEVYLALATRIAPLSMEEIQALGVKITTAITHARERVLIQRLRALPFRDALQWKCHQTSCRQALRDAWVKILDAVGVPQAANLAVGAVLLDQMGSGRNTLCDWCASDEALAKALEDREVEMAVAEAAIAQILGTATAGWMG